MQPTRSCLQHAHAANSYHAFSLTPPPHPPTPGDCFSTLVRPYRVIPKDAQAIHHITDEMVADQPKGGNMGLALLAWMYQLCRDAGGARPVLIAHNLDR